MLRVVFDTVIFVRALINPHGIWGRLIFQHADAYTLVISPPVVAEILEVLHHATGVVQVYLFVRKWQPADIPYPDVDLGIDPAHLVDGTAGEVDPQRRKAAMMVVMSNRA